MPETVPRLADNHSGFHERRARTGNRCFSRLPHRRLRWWNRESWGENPPTIDPVACGLQTARRSSGRAATPLDTPRRANRSGLHTVAIPQDPVVPMDPVGTRPRVDSLSARLLGSVEQSTRGRHPRPARQSAGLPIRIPNTQTRRQSEAGRKLPRSRRRALWIGTSTAGDGLGWLHGQRSGHYVRHRTIAGYRAMRGDGGGQTLRQSRGNRDVAKHSADFHIPSLNRPPLVFQRGILLQSRDHCLRFLLGQITQIGLASIQSFSDFAAFHDRLPG